jgi:nucleoside-diphosphate-sugar epimerase
MVIGSGMLAKVFKKYELQKDVLIFASGVSNSNTTSEDSFDREMGLLKSFLPYQNSTFVYFSSCDVIYAEKINKPYYFHKLAMENYLKENYPKYYIFRIPQIIGASQNNHSLINLFISNVLNSIEFNLWVNAYKNLIGIQELFRFITHIIDNQIFQNQTINITNLNYYSVLEILHTIEILTGKAACVKLIEKGFKPEYDTNIISKLSAELNFFFEENYLANSIKLNYSLK